ncbi:MAG: hypothetical protein WCT23_10095, partial [Candidatus Neomarinimicrobiota bacterium]
MEIYLIQSLNDLQLAADDMLNHTEFEIRMPNLMQQLYLTREELNDITYQMDEIIQNATCEGYDYHEWYDYHLNET